MAKKIIHQLIDDLDGTDLEAGAGETVQFGLDGHAYEIDLSRKNAHALRETLDAYVSAGRRVKPDDRGATREYSVVHLPTVRPRGDLAAIRRWARANGYQVADRGAIPKTIRAAYVART